MTSARIGEVRTLAVRLNQLLDGFGGAVNTSVMAFENFLQNFVREQTRFLLRHYSKLRVEFQFIEMLADQLEAKPCSVPIWAASNKANCSDQ